MSNLDIKRIKKVFEYIKPYKKYQLLVGIICSLQAIVTCVYPLLMQEVIDEVILNNKTFLLLYIILAIMVTFLVGIFLNFASGAYLRYIYEKMIMRLRLTVFNHIQYIKFDNRFKNDAGEYITRITDDVELITTFLTTTLLQIYNSSINIIFAIILMFYFSWKLSIVAIISTIVQIVITIKYANDVRTNQNDIRNLRTQHVSYLKHIFSKLLQIKVNNLQKYNDIDYSNYLVKSFRVGIKNFYIEIKYGSILSFISVLTSIINLIVGVQCIFSGSITVGAFFVFDSVFESFSTNMSSLLDINVEMQKVLIATERIDDLFRIENDPIGFQQQMNACNVISFANVSFKYDEDGKMAITKFTKNFVSGKIYCVIGENGSGKSTIIKLLLKLYDYYEGEIKIDDANIREINSLALYSYISYCGEDIIIYNKSIKSNILINMKYKSKEFIEEIYNICDINSIADSLTDGYESILNRESINLSLGQIGRIGIARALLKDSPIIIFDEALSHIDEKTNNKILNYIRRNSANKIIICITHDKKILNSMDEVIVLKNGKIKVSRIEV